MPTARFCLFLMLTPSASNSQNIEVYVGPGFLLRNYWMRSLRLLDSLEFSYRLMFLRMELSRVGSFLSISNLGAYFMG